MTKLNFDLFQEFFTPVCNQCRKVLLKEEITLFPGEESPV